MKHTPLFDQHVRDASVVINLKGFARAMDYQGHLAEHEAVRSSAGLCDVSHMGEIELKGADALALVQKLITNDAAKLAVNQALYSVMCDEKGSVIDDLVCFRLGHEHFLWVVNVTKTDEDFQWVVKHAAGMNVEVRNLSSETALMALQGPASREVLQRITKADLSSLNYYWLAPTTIHTARVEVPCVVSRTGYTGELGYEIMTARDHAGSVWDELMMVGRPLGIVAAGVAARESLRTEAGYLLNGNDMDGVTNPFEAGLGWTVKFSKDFIGRPALEAIQKKGVTRKLVGLEVQARLTVRNGYPLLKDGAPAGRVTSGPLWAPAADDRSLGLGYVSVEHSRPGTELEVDIRGKRRKVRVVELPLRERRVKSEPAIRTWSPYDLRFTESHVWLREESADTVSLGLSDFGQRSLGRVLCAVLPQPGDKVSTGAPLGWIDTYRKPFDLVSPVTGEVLAVDEALMKNPARINSYPYLRSGIVRIRLAAPLESAGLLGFKDYAALTAKLSEYAAWSAERRTL